MTDYEKLGAFYLGKEYDLAGGARRDEIVLYDSKDLTTHGVIIGMTGSGKTGLGICLLEEALIDNIPVIAVDPKGDLPNLLLTFPELAPEDFRPWINEQDAATRGMTPEEFAKDQAQLWKKGLAEWDQDGDRIRKLRDTVSFSVFTPGSTAGKPLSVLRTLAPPPPEMHRDADLWRDAVQGTATGLLALLGIASDPLASREHILLANILDNRWTAGESLDLAGLIRTIQKPPFQRLGVLDLESFYPAKDRFDLAMRLNNLLASPGFGAWIEGEPLDIQRLLYAEGGRPRASVISIAHLNDAERMFFMTMLLNGMLSWMRTQSGTTSLRAILYIDEVFGFFPPVANPPSKPPLLSLLKQARAFGLGVVLATQNPVDLDYKGLSNAGTWMIGRLQTEQDKARLLEGLEGAAAGSSFDRSSMDRALTALRKRVFLLHNVHDTAPIIFETRWAMSYLRGPMTREEIRRLAPGEKAATQQVAESETRSQVSESSQSANSEAPMLPPGIDVWYLPASGAGRNLRYRPGVIGIVDAHYANSRYGIDESQRLTFLAEVRNGPDPIDWSGAEQLDIAPKDLDGEPLHGGLYAELPRPAQDAKSFKGWSRDFERFIRQERAITLYRSRTFGMTSRAGESESDFRARLGQSAREKRDLEVAKIRRKFEPKLAALQNRLRRAEHAMGRETEQSTQRTIDTAISFGTAIAGAFLGRKRVSVSSTSRLGTAVGKATRIGKERSDVARAKENVAAIKQEMADLDGRLEDEITMLESSFDPASEELEPITIRAASRDISITLFGLVWCPFRESEGQLTPDW
ncbi:MAG TPA: DUF87 domain-containing protein [Thermoanaerobaculia bacterium]|nr:DUF87 domain-containing protein [Thermoanaerobaculia bacterium]